ncbi:unnamed protein product [Strongylus vulgaris]|uniref:Secreted protein n=1 Tax=Strongylus vulgaris TaxID=40348 RepID=A0A3P7JG54_STRVU|nr:unnamed protein product [Strongylus vulgaris]
MIAAVARLSVFLLDGLVRIGSVVATVCSWIETADSVSGKMKRDCSVDAVSTEAETLKLSVWIQRRQH